MHLRESDDSVPQPLESKSEGTGWADEDMRTGMNEDLWIVGAKLAGALAGAMISLIYLLPQTHREAACRFLTGLIAGLVFGSASGAALAQYFGVGGVLSAPETVLMGSAASSLSAWWVLGALSRIADKFGRR